MFTNPKGQEIGSWVERDCYCTTRKASEGQIYLYKHNFLGKYLKLPIGIQKSILDRLNASGMIKYVKVLIVPLEGRSYWTKTKIEDIYKDGVCIKEDRGKSNITKWGFQYIWDVYDKKYDLAQKTLN